MGPIVTEEEVTAKRYKGNPDYVPKIGDVVGTSNGDVATVGRLGGCASMFSNCTFGKVFYLTDPQDLTLVRPA